jgi:hypothetical protein
MADAMSELRSAGFAIDKLPEEQQRVLSSLTDEEVRVLTSVKGRLESAGDVEAHMTRPDEIGVIFW